MRLLPREEDRLLLFAAAELARRRRDRGLLLSQAEACALICDAVCEAARDGASYAEAVVAGYTVLGEADVLEGVAALVPRLEVEALFGDGSRLVVLHDPIGAPGPPLPVDPEPSWDPGGVELEVVNEGHVPVGVTSHMHVFEVNRALRFDRASAWGMRLAVPAGEKVVFEPGEPRRIRVLPFGGRRIVRGHGGLCDGPLDAPGARDTALAVARERGYRTRSCRASAGRCATGSACWRGAAAWSSRSWAACCSIPCSGRGARASASRAAGSRRSAAPAIPTRWTASRSCSIRGPRSSTPTA